MSKSTLTLDFREIKYLFNTNLHLVNAENQYNIYALHDSVWYRFQFTNAGLNVSSIIKNHFQSNQLRKVFSIGEDLDLLIATLPQTVRIYKSANQNVKIAYDHRNVNFDWSNNGNDIIFGRFFNEFNRMGAIVTVGGRMSEIFEITNQEEIFGFNGIPFNRTVINKYCEKSTKVMVTRLRKDPKEMIVTKDETGLCVFEFDASSNLTFNMKILIPKINQSDKVLFANLSGHKSWMDVIVLTASGLFIFGYKKESSNVYELINYNPTFSVEYGWKDKHTESLRFVDVDDDGFDDIIFTGPGGIKILSYDVFTNEWRPLLYTGDISVNERHTRVLQVLPQVQETILGPTLFTYHSGNLYLAHFYEKSARDLFNVLSVNEKFPVTFTATTAVPKIKNQRSEESKAIIYLRDMNIWFDKSESINPQTGKPYFVLPLVGDSNSLVKFHLNYDGSNTFSESLGLGWSTAKNFIQLNYEDGNFKEDESYFIVMDGIPNKLTPVSTNSTSYELFKLQTENDERKSAKSKIEAHFYSTSSTWVVDYKFGLRQYYGKFNGHSFGSVTTDASWKNWRGRGFDNFDRVEKPNRWYLAVSDTDGVPTYYKYEVIRRNVSETNVSYNANVLLKNIFNNFKRITFSYNSTNNLLSNYTYETKTNQQRVLFKYNTTGNTHLLTSIEQESDYIDHPVIQFQYAEPKKGNQLLEKVFLPTGTQIIYNFNLLGHPAPINEHKSREVLVTDQHIVSYGPDYILISYESYGKVIFRMFNHDLSKEINPLESKNKSTKIYCPHIGEKVEAHELLLAESFFAVIVYSSQWKTVCQFGRRADNTWTPERCSNYGQESTILKGDNYLLISDPANPKIIVLEWSRVKSRWEPTEKVINNRFRRVVAVSGNKFVIYNDDAIYLAYKDTMESKDWIFKELIHTPECISSTYDILRKFDLNKNFEKALFGFFKNNALLINKNIVVLNSIAFYNNEYFVTKIRTYLIGRDHEVVKESYTIVDQDILTELESEKESNNLSHMFSMKYFYDGDKFKIVLGKIGITEAPKKMLNEKIFNEMNSPAKRFFLDLKNYSVTLRGSTIECRNVTYTFGGQDWRRSYKNTTINAIRSIPFGNRFFVNQTDKHSTIKLFDATNEKEILDFEVNDFQEVQINYPNYIAVQGNEKNPPMVIEFIDRNSSNYKNWTLERSKQLSKYSNSLYFVSHETISNDLKTLFIKRIPDIRLFLPNVVVSAIQTVINGTTSGSKSRTTGYKYNAGNAHLALDTIYYNSLIVVPLNNRYAYGYFNISARYVEFFSSDNELVKTLDKENYSKSEGNEDYDPIIKETTILYSKLGHIEIAQFSPFPINSEMCGFMGFENYEQPLSHWKFEDDQIVNGNFSLTGDNYLRLDKSILKGIFQPKFQDHQFLASCWLRTNLEKIPKLGDIVAHLTATVMSPDGKEIINVLSDVKYQIDDWSYLEVVVDLRFIHLALKATNQNVEKNLQIEIIIAPTRDVTIDLDHVRFSPLNSIFEVNVYDENMDKPVAIIKPSGAISRKLYDKYDVMIAEINESNQIKELSTYSKGSYGGGIFANPSNVIMITPERGFYEWFSPIAFHNRWSLTDVHTWNIAPATVQHHTAQRSNMKLTSGDIDPDSHGIRFLYSLKDQSLISISSCIQLQRHKGKTNILLADKSTTQMIPNEGEIILIKDNGRVLVWIDGGLYIDQHSFHTTSLVIEVEGEVQIQHMMIFGRPKVQVTYKNSLNEVIQHVSLSSAWSSVVSEWLYDELGRQSITVQPVEITRAKKEPLMAYAAAFVINDDFERTDSIWKIGKLKGEATKIIGHEYPFTRTIYDNNPLNVKLRTGLPGREFSTYGFYGRRFESTPTKDFLLTMYPHSGNFTYEIEIEPYGDERISIFDKNNLKVASYMHLKDEKDLFSTFQYDDRGSMVKCKPPMYYSNFGIFNKDENLIVIHPPFDPLEIHIEYDAKGNRCRKSTQDTGLLENKYDNDNNLRFVIQHSRDKPNVVDYITYFKYDALGRLASTGNLKSSYRMDTLLSLNITEEIAVEYQSFYYSDTERDPAVRGQILRTITKFEQEEIYEESIYDVGSNLISKRNIIPNGIDEPIILSIDKQFQNGLLKKIIYPGTMFDDVFQVTYEYDESGRMTSVGIPGDFNRFLSVIYDAGNRITTESFSSFSKNQFYRNYKYNDPGYLIEIDDPFLREEISYTANGYGRKGYGDGTVTRIKFTAKWHKSANINESIVRPDSFQNDHISLVESQRCFRELKKEGYLDDGNFQTRVLYQNLNSHLSLACTNGKMMWHVKEILGKFGFPKMYGFRFDYRHYRELKKGKYFVGDITEEPEAFLSDSFDRKIAVIDKKKSQQIWNLLKAGGYIVEDNSYAKLGKSIIRKSLVNDLKAVNPEFEKFTPMVEKLLIRAFIKKLSILPVSRVVRIFDPDFANKINYARSIRQILLEKDYIKNPIEETFINILRDFNYCLVEIVEVIQNHLSLDRAEFDVETMEIDSNGNRIRFNVGFDNYFLYYEANSNRITYISKSSCIDGKQKQNTFLVYHDSRGNVIKAMHKNIELMEYHPVSNRLVKVLLTNGNVVTYRYDSKGERVFKRLTDHEGNIKCEMHYLRDEKGRTLVERKIIFIEENHEPDSFVTMYIYGPKSLIGFVRRNQFYNVITDHQGSVRLVVCDGEIVAAYDYMPYGKLMRSYESTPEASIPYLYTGQEWDSEIELYNFHARLYDPVIGRFYQVDSIMQYFSPYKYAGNSPVSMVDPTGSIAFLFIVAVLGFTLLCAYVAGAAVNNDYNILNWDWSDSETQVAIVLGGISGALIPLGFVASVAVLTALSITSIASAAVTASLGLLISYITVGAQTGIWNPIKWDYTSFKTYNYALEGFSKGVNILSMRYKPFARFMVIPRRIQSVLNFERKKLRQIHLQKAVDNAIAADFPTFPQQYPSGLSHRFDRKLQRSLLGNENLNLQVIEMGSDGSHLPPLFASDMNFIYGDTYYDYISVAVFESNSLRKTDATIDSFMALATEKLPNRLTELVSQKTRTFENLIGNILKTSKCSLGTHDVAIFRFSSDNVLSIELSNITLVYTENGFINPFLCTTSNVTYSDTTRQMTSRVNYVTNAFLKKDSSYGNINQMNFIFTKLSECIYNVDTFRKGGNKICKKILHNLLLQSDQLGIDQNHIKSMLNEMQIQNKIRRPIVRMYRNKQKLWHQVQPQLSNRTLSFYSRNKLSIKSKFLGIFVKNCKSEVRARRNTLVKSLSDKFKDLQMPWIKWQLRNTAEPSLEAILLLSKSSSFKHLNGYNSTKKFLPLSSYNIEDIPDLTGFEKCYTCIHQTSKTRTKVADVTWLAMLNSNSNRKLEIVTPNKKPIQTKRKRRSIVETDNLKTNLKTIEEERSGKMSTFFRKVVQRLQGMWPNSRGLEITNITKLRQQDLISSSFVKNENQTRANTSWNIVEFGDEYVSQMPFNETLLLAEFCFAKRNVKRKFGKSLASTHGNNYLQIQIQDFSCEVIQLYDEAVTFSALASGIGNARLDKSTYPELYEKIIRLATSRKFDEILDLLNEYVMKILPKSNRDTPGRLSQRKQIKFHDTFIDFNLKLRINKTLVKMNGLMEDFN